MVLGLEYRNLSIFLIVSRHIIQIISGTFQYSGFFQYAKFNKVL